MECIKYKIENTTWNVCGGFLHPSLRICSTSVKEVCLTVFSLGDVYKFYTQSGKSVQSLLSKTHITPGIMYVYGKVTSQKTKGLFPIQNHMCKFYMFETFHITMSICNNNLTIDQMTRCVLRCFTIYNFANLITTRRYGAVLVMLTTLVVHLCNSVKSIIREAITAPRQGVKRPPGDGVVAAETTEWRNKGRTSYMMQKDQYMRPCLKRMPTLS